MFPVTETMYNEWNDSTEYIQNANVSFTYSVLGGIANRSPFRPDTGREGLCFLY